MDSFNHSLKLLYDDGDTNWYICQKCKIKLYKDMHGSLWHWIYSEPLSNSTWVICKLTCDEVIIKNILE